MADYEGNTTTYLDGSSGKCHSLHTIESVLKVFLRTLSFPTLFKNTYYIDSSKMQTAVDCLIDGALAA